MAVDNKLSAEQANKLSDELTALSKQQSEALLSSAYIRMSLEEAKEYDKRRIRIGEICELLAKFKPSNGNKP